MRRSNAERTASTRAALVSSARRLFETSGYTATATEDIVREAGVTRGALYHHFDDKRDLLRAVVIEIQQEIADRVFTEAAKHQDPWEFFLGGWFGFLDRADDPAVKVLMIDAPPVIGIEEWSEIDDLYCLQPAIAGLQYLMDEEVIDREPVEPLGRVLLTASNALATHIASSPNPRRTRKEVTRIWRRMLEGTLRPKTASQP